MSERAEIVVIGGGLIGCSIALECARRGRKVTVLEKLDQVGQGSTARSTAIIRQLYHERHSIKLAIEGLKLWEEWAKYLGHDEDLVQFHQPGILWVLKPVLMASMPVRTLKELGADIEVLDEPSLTQRFPSFRFTGPLAGAPVAGLFEKRGGYVEDPARAVRNLAEAARRAGVTFRLSEGVAAIEHDDSALSQTGRRRVRALVTDRGARIEADVVVNAGGPHSAALNLMAGCPLPLTTAPNLQQFIEGRETALNWNGSGKPPFPVCADPVNGIYFRPDPRAFRIGTVLPADDRHFLASADQLLPEPTPEFMADKLERLRGRQPGARLLGLKGTSALYDVTVADWCPILDKTDLDGWFVAIGTSGKWFKSGPVIGWIMAELIQWISRGHDPDKPHDRLTIRLPRTGHELALADFARWRVPHATGGVLA
ncbi:MAG: FAD-dependent oxidoreductase [Candidatus Eisenbacteria bacterium]|nr:FAD-dependent oxidoreductase [Candidatus Eisenbacteria bacterium]